MKRILVLANYDDFYNTRKEVIEELLKAYDITICYPYGPNVKRFKNMGCRYQDISIDRRGKNVFKDLKLLKKYNDIIKNIKPDIVLTYSIKPNIYGGYICSKLNIPCIANITGLGTALENKGTLQKIAILLHKICLKNNHTIFVQNKDNQDFFIKNNIHPQVLQLIPGSGVNLNDFEYIPFPSIREKHFLYIARVMKEKGIEEYLNAAIQIKKEYSNAYFHVLGFCEENYKETLQELENQGVIKYHGLVNDVKKFHKFSCCTIHPSYYPEGMSNVLLEACACGRPVITTERSGCKEIVDDEITGLIFKQRDTNDLINKIKKFLQLKDDEQEEMGKQARLYVKQKFDRTIVINAYRDKISEVLKEDFS